MKQIFSVNQFFKSKRDCVNYTETTAIRQVCFQLKIIAETGVIKDSAENNSQGEIKHAVSCKVGLRRFAVASLV